MKKLQVKNSQQLKAEEKPQRKPLNAEESREKYMSLVRKGVIQIKLPSSYPPMFHTWETYKDSNLKDVSLLYRKNIAQQLAYLHESVKPIAREFELYYSLFTEGHPSIIGHAFTKKIKILISSPLEKQKEYLTTYHVYIKLRDPNKPNDSKLFLNKTTSMAIMLHELAHLRCYDHSFNFALLLRDIYKSAIKLNLFPNQSEEHMIPSRRSWERVLFQRKGNMTDEELKVVYDEFINSQENNNNQLDDSLIQEDNISKEKENKVNQENNLACCQNSNENLTQLLNAEDSKMEIEEEINNNNNVPDQNKQNPPSKTLKTGINQRKTILTSSQTNLNKNVAQAVNKLPLIKNLGQNQNKPALEQTKIVQTKYSFSQQSQRIKLPSTKKNIMPLNKSQEKLQKI
ncbi:hypothetical protein ABPG72_020796 [Tetrahymena utriculariae]